MVKYPVAAFLLQSREFDSISKMEMVEMIGIITDSTCDIPDNLLNRFGIIVVPQVLIWGEEQYRDRIDLQPAEFYHRLEVDHKLPHSSQPSQREFEAAYESAASRGFKELIVLTISSALSGTFEIAKTAAKSFNIPVEVIDSRAASMGLGWQVLAAAGHAKMMEP